MDNTSDETFTLWEMSSDYTSFGQSVSTTGSMWSAASRVFIGETDDYSTLPLNQRLEGIERWVTEESRKFTDLENVILKLVADIEANRRKEIKHFEANDVYEVHKKIERLERQFVERLNSQSEALMDKWFLVKWMTIINVSLIFVNLFIMIFGQ